MASVMDLVKHYQRSIEKYPNDEQKILKSIDKLYNLKVTVQHLQDTGVGRTVNALRKEPGEVGQAARALVLKWKVMVAAEESDQEDHNDDTQTYSTHDNGRDYESNSARSTSRHDTSEKSERRLKTEERYDKDTNGDYSGNKRKYQSSEEEDHDTKKSKYSRDNGYNIKLNSQVRTEPTESEDSQDESSQSDSSEDSQSEDEVERIPETETKVEKNYEPKDSQKSSHLKQSSSSHQDKSKHDSRHSKEETRHNKNSDSSDKRHASDKSKEKSQSSHVHKSSKEHEKSSDKKEKENRHSEKEKHCKEDSSKHSDKHRSSSSSDKDKSISTEKHKSASSSDKHKSSENSQKHKSSRSEDKHKSSSSSEKNKKVSTENNKSHTEKTSSNTDKQSSHKSDKERHKKSEKETSNDKHKSKERDDRKDEQVKDKSKVKHSSSKDKESHKSEKKHSSKETELRDSKRKSESSSSSDNSKKSKHKSSKQSSKSKDKEKQPKKSEDSDDGIDCGSGASFAEALGMISPSKPKKKSIFSKDNIQSPYSPNGDLSPPNLLAPTAKLAPLPSLEISALPEISPNYRPRPPPKFQPHFSDEDAMSNAVSSKNQRTKVYSGNKVIGKITTLYEMCVQVLQEHIDALEYTGGVPYEILKPVVDKATPQQLFVLEHYNPYLMDDTDHLWQKFCEKNFRNKKRQEMETWREMYIRCQEEQEIKLKSLTANIRMTQEAKKAPIKQTKMAYVDTVVKPPRNIAKKQAQHGTAFAATASPAARVASLSAAPNVLKGGRAATAPVLTNSSSFKPKKAPLMQKALQFMRGRKR